MTEKNTVPQIAALERLERAFARQAVVAHLERHVIPPRLRVTMPRTPGELVYADRRETGWCFRWDLLTAAHSVDDPDGAAWRITRELEAQQRTAKAQG